MTAEQTAEVREMVRAELASYVPEGIVRKIVRDEIRFSVYVIGIAIGIVSAVLAVVGYFAWDNLKQSYSEKAAREAVLQLAGNDQFIADVGGHVKSGITIVSNSNRAILFASKTDGENYFTINDLREINQGFNVPDDASGIVLIAMVINEENGPSNRYALISTFSCADADGSFANPNHFLDTGITNATWGYVGGVVFCPLSQHGNDRRIKFRGSRDNVLDNKIKYYVSAIGWY